MNRRLVSIALLLLCAAGCAPGIHIQRLAPARYNLGASRRIAILEVSGVDPGTEVLVRQLSQGVMERRHFTLYNAAHRGLTFVVPGLGARIELGEVRQAVEADVYVIARVTDYRDGDVKGTDKEGKEALKPAGFATVSFQVVKSDGRVLVYRDYSEVTESSDGTARYDLRERSMDKVVGQFLTDITPHFVTEKIELDKDERLKPGIELAESGDLAGASRSWQQVLDADPQHAGAVFNLGVAYEALGEFEKAAEHYQRALSIKPKALYSDALQDLQRRLDERRALDLRM